MKQQKKLNPKEQFVIEREAIRQDTQTAIHKANKQMAKIDCVEVFTNFYFGKAQEQKLWIGMPRLRWQEHFSDCKMREIKPVNGYCDVR